MECVICPTSRDGFSTPAVPLRWLPETGTVWLGSKPASLNDQQHDAPTCPSVCEATIDRYPTMSSAKKEMRRPDLSTNPTFLVPAINSTAAPQQHSLDCAYALPSTRNKTPANTSRKRSHPVSGPGAQGRRRRSPVHPSVDPTHGRNVPAQPLHRMVSPHPTGEALPSEPPTLLCCPFLARDYWPFYKPGGAARLVVFHPHAPAAMRAPSRGFVGWDFTHTRESQTSRGNGW